MAPPRTFVLVEGMSDKVALETLAARRGRNFDAEGISIMAMGGAHAVGRFLELFSRKESVRMAGVCDAGEERVFQRALERSGLGHDLTRADMELLGFYVCVADLEDELIRSLGTTAVEEILHAKGDLRSFRVLQKQPAHQGRPVEDQLRRFLGTHSGRKAEYARALARELDLERVPRPLDLLLAHI